MTEQQATLDFVLKCNLTAQEIRLSTGKDLQTLGDLRRIVSEIYDLPLDRQRLIHNGKGLHAYPENEAYPETCLLSHFLRTPWEGDRIVFVLAVGRE